MPTPLSTTSTATLTPGRGLRSFSNPGDPATFPGAAGINWGITLGALDYLWGVPTTITNKGATYLSNIHGALGSDMVNPNSTPTSGFPSGVPAFAGPEVTGYYTSGPNMGNKTLNGLYNTEKVQRNASDNPAGNATIQLGVQGRRSLNFCLWISPAAPVDYCKLSLYRDINAQDKIGGFFGAGGGPTDVSNAVLVAQWVALGAARDQNKPNFVTNGPFEIPADTSLYMIFQNLNGNGSNAVVGGLWLS